MSNETPSPSPYTPTPWHVGPYYRSDVESREGRVCECVQLNTPRGIANAEFIVHAVNCHEALVAALRACEAVLAESAGSSYNVTRQLTDAELGKLWIAVTEQARAALATADASRTRGAVEK